MKADPKGLMICPDTGFRYREEEPGVVRCVDVQEAQLLPPGLRSGRVAYKAVENRPEPGGVPPDREEA